MSVNLFEFFSLKFENYLQAYFLSLIFFYAFSMLCVMCSFCCAFSIILSLFDTLWQNSQQLNIVCSKIMYLPLRIIKSYEKTCEGYIQVGKLVRIQDDFSMVVHRKSIKGTNYLCKYVKICLQVCK